MRHAIVVLARTGAVLVPVALGLVLLLRAAGDREPPTLVTVEEAVTPVRVLTVNPQSVVPRVSAHGAVEPAATWRAVAQVPGEVISLYADLRPGRLIAAGTEIVALDATDFTLAEAQASASLAGADARLAELQTRESNLRASLAIEQRAVDLAEADLTRYRLLLERGTASPVAVDQAESQLLQRRARVQEIESELRLMPLHTRVQEAEQVIAATALAAARRDIERTRILMPFDGRIAEVDLERGQFVSAGSVLLVAEDLSRVEVPTRLRLEQLRTLVPQHPDRLSVDELTTTEFDAVPREFGLEAELRMPLGTGTASWPATVQRLSFALDAQTRTIGLVVGVDHPLRLASPGTRPPLLRDMFVEIVIRGRAIDDAFLIPREALRPDDAGGWNAWLVDPDDRLAVRPVRVHAVMGNAAVITAGLADGDRVVAGEIRLPVPGMRLAPREDASLEARIRESADEVLP